MTDDTSDATVIRAGAAATLFVAVGTFLTTRLAPGTGRLPLVAGVLTVAAAGVLIGVVSERTGVGAGVALAGSAVAVVAWTTPVSTYPTMSVVLVVLAVVELLAAPALARLGRFGRSTGDWLQRR
ncbi:hypothetical protein [Halobaculum sp. MBLA0143]|uniref:hypothetical protein n=1 Tax=Halobaculum sp. MBLA0143 TaxID=3079933 RepID=UPI003523F2CA